MPLDVVQTATKSPAAPSEPVQSVDPAIALERFVSQKADPPSVQTLVDLGEPGRDAVAAWWQKRRRSAESTEWVARFAARCGAPCGLLLIDLMSTHHAQESTAEAIFALPPSDIRQRLVREGAQRAKTDALKSRFVAELGLDPGDSAHSLAMSFVSSKNPGWRYAAMSALATIARPEDCHVLLQLLSHQRVAAGEESTSARQALISALGVARCEPAAAALVQELGDVCCRDRAVAALVKIGQPAASALSLVLKSGDRVRLGSAIEALLAIGALNGADLAKSIATGTPQLRAAARDLLIATRPNGVGETLAAELRTANVAEALSLLDVGVQLSPDEARIVLRESLSHSNEKVRWAAVERIGKAGLTYATTELRLAATTDASVAVRAAALLAIHRMAERSCVDVLEAAANREDERLRVIAINALADLGGSDQIMLLIPLLQANSSPVREAAHHALIRLMGVSLPPASGEWRRYWQTYATPWFSDPFAAATGQSLDTGSGRVIRWVEVGSGPVVVVLGGAPDGGSSYLRYLVAPLTDRFRVVVVDLPGSVAWADLGDVTACSPDRDVADINALRTTIAADRVDLVGHSFGVQVAVHFAQNYPDVVGAVALLNESLGGLTMDAAEVRRAAETLPEPWKGDLEGFLSMAHDYSSDARREIQWRMLARGMVPSDAAYRWLVTAVSPTAGTAAKVAEAWAHVDTLGSLAQLTAPVLVVSNPETIGKAVLSVDKLRPLLETGRIDVLSLGQSGSPIVDRDNADVVAKRLMAFFER